MAYERQKNIFLYLLNSDEALSGRELSKIFNVTTRTIRSDIKSLNELLKKHNIGISSSKQDGYFISDEDKAKGFEIVEEVLNKEVNLVGIPSTPSERFAFIVFKLAFALDYITMEEIADMLFVSKTTVYLDIQKIMEFLSSFPNLELEISPIKGMKLKGDERSKRFLISNILKREKTYDDLMLSKAFYYAFNDKKTNLNNEMLFLYETIINILNKHGYILTDADVNLLVKDILISIKRIQMGFTVEEAIIEDLDLTIAEDLKKEVEDYFNILINERELEYFQQSFNAKRLLNVESDKYVLKTEAQIIVEEFIIDIKNKFNIDFTQNESFRNNLILHLNPMIERIKNNYFEANPLTNQIKTNYPLAFEISMLIVPIINEKLGVIINEAEVSYIALHVAVALDEKNKKSNIAIICGSGLGTARLVMSKISSYYGEWINIIGYFPIYKLDNILKGEYGKVDLIVSTIPITYRGEIPIIQVNPLINEEDLMKLGQYIGNPIMQIKNSGIKELKYQIFREELFKYFTEEISYFGAISELVKMLKLENYIDDKDKFYESVILRENLFSTILDEEIAIPHPMESMSKTTVVSVGIFKNPIVHNGKKVKIIFLFAVNAKEDEKLKVLYSLLQEILESKETIETLYKSKNFDDFIENIKL